MNIREMIKRRRRFILYGLTGCANTLVDMLVFEVLGFFGLGVIPRQAIGYCAGILCSYLLNSRFAFKGGSGGSKYMQRFRFILVNGIALLVGMIGIQLLVDAGLVEEIAKVIITVIVAIVNYFAYKILVFKVKD